MEHFSFCLLNWSVGWY